MEPGADSAESAEKGEEMKELTLDEARSALDAGKKVVDKDGDVWAKGDYCHPIIRDASSLSIEHAPYYLHEDDPAPAPRWQSETCGTCGYKDYETYCRKHECDCFCEFKHGWDKACPDWQGREL
jgi:hypothetical protein